jgi:Arc/MetJ-type ribon-helix-helix transcriptional regulator
VECQESLPVVDRESILERLDKLVERAVFSSRSQAMQEAVEEKLARMERSRLARECAKLDPTFERALAEELEQVIEGLNEIIGP